MFGQTRKGLDKRREDAKKIKGNEGMTCQGSRRKGTEWPTMSQSVEESSKMRTGRVHWISQFRGHSVE